LSTYYNIHIFGPGILELGTRRIPCLGYSEVGVEEVTASLLIGLSHLYLVIFDPNIIIDLMLKLLQVSLYL
jgi:hypothetical protein